ncbi:LysE family translocator [Aquiflexum sp.]|uniref:LysE family translocator n=1 Tax=Aquiflexum sp. TaxID=1872584 RepID=UPI0035932EBF
MNQALLEGFSMGLLLSAMIGPVFFTLIQNSIENGFRHTFILALGVLSSDLIYVIITFFGISLLSQNPYFEVLLGYIGGAVLVGFGISAFFKKNKGRISSGGLTFPKAKKTTGFLKGFGINGINPFVMLFWISIAGLVNLKQDFNKTDIFLYYFGILFTVFSIDLLKAYIAKQLKSFVTPGLMKNLNIVVAIVLVFFGLRLIKFAWERHVLFP